MKRTLFLFACVATVLSLAVSATAKGGPQPLHLDNGNGGNIEIQQPVEQWTDWGFNGSYCCEFLQPWVTNPTGVAWDVDDHWEKIDTDAYLTGNTTMTTVSQEVADTTQAYHCVWDGSSADCAWWSGGGRDFQVFVGAPASMLIVTACYQPQGRCFTAPPAYDAPNKRYLYGLCIAVRYTPTDAAVAMIPGSNGDAFPPDPYYGLPRGLGLVTTETVTISNPTGHTVRNIFASVQMVGTGGDGHVCSPTTNRINTFDYPFSWYMTG